MFLLALTVLTHKWLKQKDLRLREVPKYTGKILTSFLQMNWTFQVTLMLHKAYELK